MGLLRPIRNPVEGTAFVDDADQRPSGAMFANCKVWLTVQAPGVAPFKLKGKYIGPMRTNKWPMPGTTLPVTFDRDHPDRFRIEWDRVLDRDDFVEGLQAYRWVEQMGDLAPAAAAPPTAPAPNVLDELDKLGRMHERGVLTDDEFAAQKAKLLAS